MRAIGLDCLTLFELEPDELIRVAHRTGFATVSIWVVPGLPDSRLATAARAPMIRQAMADTGMTIGNLEVFNINGDDPVDAFEPALAFGAGLGARSATAIDYGPPRSDIATRFAQFCRLARKHGLEPLIEPIAMGATRTIREGAGLIAAAGEPARIVLDMLHFVRTGSTLADLEAIDRQLIGYVQICDGPLTMAPDALATEAVEERLYPGEGAFPIEPILRAVPGTASVAVEVPSRSRRFRGQSAQNRANAAFAATTAVLARMEGGACQPQL